MAEEGDRPAVCRSRRPALPVEGRAPESALIVIFTLLPANRPNHRPQMMATTAPETRITTNAMVNALRRGVHGRAQGPQQQRELVQRPQQ